MKNRTKAFLLSIVIGGILIYYNYSKFGITDVFEAFKNFTPTLLLTYASAVILIELFLVVRWNIILNSFKLKVPFHNLFLYRMSGYAVGYLSPQAHIGGEPVRALLLKRHNIKFKKGISTVLIDKSMQITTDVLFATLGAFSLILHFSISRKTTALIIGFILAWVLLLIFYFYCMIKKKPFFSAVLNLKVLKKFKSMRKLKKDVLEVEHIIHTFYVEHRKSFLKVVFINLFLYTLMVIEYSSAIALFGFTPSFYTTFIVMGGVAFSYSFPVPMALGVLETAQVSALGILDLNKAIGLSISILVRLKDVMRTLIGGLSLFYYGMSLGLIWKQIKGKKNAEQTK